MPQYLLHIRPMTNRSSWVFQELDKYTLYSLHRRSTHVWFFCCICGTLSCTLTTPNLMLPSHQTRLESCSARAADTPVENRVLGSSGCMAANTAPAGLLEKLIKILKSWPSTTTARIKRACLGILGLWQSRLCLLSCQWQKCSFLPPCDAQQGASIVPQPQGRPTASWIV